MELREPTYLEHFHGTLRDELGRLLTHDFAFLDKDVFLEAATNAGSFGACVRQGFAGTANVDAHDSGARERAFAREAMSAFDGLLQRELGANASRRPPSEAAFRWLQRVKDAHAQLGKTSESLRGARSEFDWAEVLANRELSYLQTLGPIFASGARSSRCASRAENAVLFDAASSDQQEYFDDLACLSRQVEGLKEKLKSEALVRQLAIEGAAIQDEAREVLEARFKAAENRAAEVASLCSTLEGLGIDPVVAMQDASSSAHDGRQSSLGSARASPSKSPHWLYEPTPPPSRPSSTRPASSAWPCISGTSRCQTRQGSRPTTRGGQSTSGRLGGSRQGSKRLRSKARTIADGDVLQSQPAGSTAATPACDIVDSKDLGWDSDEERMMAVLREAASARADIVSEGQPRSKTKAVASHWEIKAKLGGRNLQQSDGFIQDGPGFGSDPDRMRDLRTPWSELKSSSDASWRGGFQVSTAAASPELPQPDVGHVVSGGMVKLSKASNGVMHEKDGMVWLVGSA